MKSNRPATIGDLMSVGTAIRWLAGVFLLSIVLVLGLLEFFSHLKDDLHQRELNEQARLFIGEEIVRGIYDIEKDFYRMTMTTNPAGMKRIRTLIDRHAEKLMHDMEVLKNGGTVRRLAPLNLEGHDDVVREVTYQVQRQDKEFVLEQIEIVPLLDQLGSKTGELETLLAQRWEHQESGNRENFFRIEEKTALFLKQLPPFFERLEENANRLFFEGDKELRELEIQLQTQRQRLKLAEIGLIGLVVAFAGIIGILFLRRINYANLRLESALDEAIATRNEIDSLREQNTAILNTLSDGIYATDMEGRVTFMNSAAENILGWQEQELRGTTIHAAVHHSYPNGENFPNDQCPLLDVLLNVATLSGEEHFIARDGRFIPVSYRAIPLFRHNELVGSLVSFQDITHRQQSEALIRLQKAALDAAANMIAITARNGLIEYVNKAFCQVTGYSPEEVIGKHNRILKSGRQEAGFYEKMWNTLLDGQPWEGELINRRKDGVLYPEQMTITPIIEDGEITHFVAIKRDISQEAATRTRLKLIEAAIRNIDQGLLITDTDFGKDGAVILYTNPGFSRITGYLPEEVLGRRTAILNGPQTDLALLGEVQEALQQGRSISSETVFLRKNGTPYDVELQCSPVRNDNGQITHYIGLISDISPRKLAEEAMRQARDQALENSRLKSEFLSTMSHEIRTPMNGIIGMTDLLLDTPLNAEQRDFTGIVRDSAQSLLLIINDILDFSKIEAGKMEIETTDFSPVHIVEGVAELLAPKAREKKLALNTFIDPALPSLLRGDPMRIRQVLVNLVGNAIKFTEHGDVQVRALSDVVRQAVCFEIQDTGIGMAPEIQDRLFQSFSQADSSTTRKYGGTGLGLAISKRLVELMGGEIGVESRAGQGSTFRFTLPLTAALHPPLPTPRQIDLRVLVVDQRATDCAIIQRYLHSWGMHGEVASDAAQALAMMSAAHSAGAPYDVVLVDFALPGENGLGLAQAIRADQRFSLTRLMLLTDFDQRDLLEDARSAGFSAYLTKPVRQSQLFDGIAAKLEEGVASDADSGIDSVRDSVPTIQDALKTRRLILLAEDNPTNQKVAQLQLNKLGYAVHIVNNGKEAVEAAATLPYAAILMDCQMPVMDGFEATAMIRKSEQPGDARVPVIAMTANAMQGDRERCLAAGMDDYISKPVSPDKLARALSTWAKGSTAAEPDEPAADAPDTTAIPAPISMDRLKEYFGDDPELIAELLEVFRSSTATVLAKLRAAVERNDGPAIKALAHEAKGACSNLGIQVMVDKAAALEIAAEQQDWQGSKTLCSAIEASFRDIAGFIESYRKETTC